MIRVTSGNKDDSDDEDVFGRGSEPVEQSSNELRKSYGKKGTGGLAAMKSKLSLSEELGAMKSELNSFYTEK